MSNTSINGEEELNNSSSEDELSNENSSTISLLDMDIQEVHLYTCNTIFSIIGMFCFVVGGIH